MPISPGRPDPVAPGHGHGVNRIAGDDLLPLVYDELRRLAVWQMDREKPGQTLQPTALVHEAWLRLEKGDPAGGWGSRGHFCCAAAEAMRRILVDQARRKSRQRHGGNHERVDLESLTVTLAAEDPDETVLALHDALDRLAAVAPEQARIVKLRYFAGFEHAAIARVLGVSEPTVRRRWAYARAWLFAELTGNRER